MSLLSHKIHLTPTPSQRQALACALDDRLAYLSVVGAVKLTESLRFRGKIMSGAVSRIADDWFLSVQVQLPDDYTRENETTCDGLVGVDLGLKTFVTTSDGEFIQAPKPLKFYTKRLQRLSRQHSKKQRGSSNKKKSAMKLAKLHQRIASIRFDFLHKLTTKLLRENQVIVIEDLNVRGMMTNRRLSRALSDVGLSEFRRQLQYKAPLFNRNVIVADRFFPSTKRCNACGNVKAYVGLDEREYTCERCGVVEDRDFNASLNLKDWCLIYLNKLPEAIGDVKPVEISALTSASAGVKLKSKKQEFSSFELRK